MADAALRSSGSSVWPASRKEKNKGHVIANIDCLTSQQEYSIHMETLKAGKFGSYGDSKDWKKWVFACSYMYRALSREGSMSYRICFGIRLPPLITKHGVLRNRCILICIHIGLNKFWGLHIKGFDFVIQEMLEMDISCIYIGCFSFCLFDFF